MKSRRILFVCTGNTCRSVMAQGLLQQRLKQLEGRLRGPIEVVSAGVFAIEGMSPSRETLKLLQHAGVDLAGHMAQGLTDEMIRQAELVLVMEPFHREEILRRLPEAAGKTHLLKQFGVPETAESLAAGIPDPIGKPMEVYEACLAIIQEAVERVAQHVASSEKSA